MAVWCLELLPALLLMVVYWTAGDRSVTMATTANIGRYPTANSTFTWLASAWGDCVHREAGTCCACYRTRNVSCVLRGDLTRVPAFYCHKLLGVEPGVREPCSPCQQDCVLSTWGQWSACSQTCPPASRYRMRQILVLPQDGGERCGNLMEEERCPPSQSQAATWACGDARDHRPRYSWKYNGWTGCRKVRIYNRSPTLGMKGGICHFAKWQIHLFISKVRIKIHQVGIYIIYMNIM